MTLCAGNLFKQKGEPMMKKIPEKMYNQIRKYVPILCVDTIIINHRGILLKKRQSEPYKGQYSIIGGAVAKNEKVIDAVKRHLWDELGITVKNKNIQFLNYYEWSPEDDPRQHPISLIFMVWLGKQIPKEGEFFHRLPGDMDPAARKALNKFVSVKDYNHEQGCRRYIRQILNCDS